MWQVLLYTLGISVALSLAGFCGERLSSMLGRSKRFIWAAAMLLSILWPLGMMLSARPLPPPVLVAAQSGVPAQAVTLDVPAARMATPVPLAMEPEAAAGMPARTQKKWREWLPSDRLLLQAWALVSGALLLCLAGTESHASAGAEPGAGRRTDACTFARECGSAHGAR